MQPIDRRGALRILLGAAVATRAAAASADAASDPALAPASDLRVALRALAPGGRVLLLRHAQTSPGVGDPPGYALENCASQRNLNALGRAQSRRLGRALALEGLAIGEALSSRWCRCVDTARLALAAAGQPELEIEIFEPLNNLWDDRSGEAAAVAANRARIAAWRGPGTLLMVSHGVTIRPTAGRGVGQGGFLAIVPGATPDGFEIAAAGAL